MKWPLDFWDLGIRTSFVIRQSTFVIIKECSQYRS